MSCCKRPVRLARNSDTQRVPSLTACDCSADFRLLAWWMPGFEEICGSGCRQRKHHEGIHRRSLWKKKDGAWIGEMPDPELRQDDVLVRIHAAGVNLLDSKIRNGEFKLLLPYRLPLILGNDAAGVVVRVGSAVRRFKPGDGVYARPHQDRIGTFAEFIAMNEADVALKPKNLTMEEAASIPLVGLTAWQVLIERANLKKGQRVLIHAGSGGVGTFAIQLAKHLGATVATTTSTTNVDLVKSLGADVVIDYKKEDFEK